MSEKELIAFATEILGYIDPKYHDESQFDFDLQKIIRFASKSILTASEFMNALDMSSRKTLTLDGNKVEYYREINENQLGTIEAAYLQFKRGNVNYINGKEKVKKYLNPEPIISEEEIKATKKNNWENLKSAVSENKPCSHAFLFFDNLVKKGNFKNFLSNKTAQQIVLSKKMKEVVIREYKTPVIFAKHEAKKNYDAMIRGEQIQIHNIAIIEVKNDLVYNHVKKQLQKLKNSTIQ